jgi:hypothetical protein
MTTTPISNTLLRGFRQLGQKFNETWATDEYTDIRSKSHFYPRGPAFICNPTFWIRSQPKTQTWQDKEDFHKKYKHYKCVPTQNGFFDVRCRKIYPTIEEWAQAAAADFGIELTKPIEEEILWGRSQTYLTLSSLLTKINNRIPPESITKSDTSYDILIEKIKQNIKTFQPENQWSIVCKQNTPSKFLYVNNSDIRTVYICNMRNRAYVSDDKYSLYKFICTDNRTWNMSPLDFAEGATIYNFYIELYSQKTGTSKWVRITELLT